MMFRVECRALNSQRSFVSFVDAVEYTLKQSINLPKYEFYVMISSQLSCQTVLVILKGKRIWSDYKVLLGRV